MKRLYKGFFVILLTFTLSFSSVFANSDNTSLSNINTDTAGVTETLENTTNSVTTDQGDDEPKSETEHELSDQPMVENALEPKDIGDVEKEGTLNIEARAATAELPKLETTNSIGISRFEIKNNRESQTYLAGEETLINIGLGMTDESPALSNARIILQVPLNHVNSITGSDISSQTYKKISKDNDFHYIEYGLRPIQGGANIDFPVKFTMNNGSTPDNWEVPVNAKIITDDGTTLKETSANYVYTVMKPNLLTKKVLIDSVFQTSDIYTVNAGQEDTNKPGYLSNNRDELQSLVFSFQASYGIDQYAPGNRLYEKAIIQDILPPEAVFIAEDNPGWTYDEASRTAVYEYQPTNPFRLSTGALKYRDFRDVQLKLKFPGAKVGESITNKQSVTFYPSNMSDKETPTTISDDIIFKLKPTPKPVSFFASKQPANARYYDAPSGRNAIHSWSLGIGNNSIKADFSDLKLENVVIKDHSLDPNLKFNSIGIGSYGVDTFVGSLDVIATMHDGSIQELAKNVTTTVASSIPFPENTASFEIKFTEGSYLVQGKSMYFYVYTELKNKEMDVLGENEQEKRMYNSVEFLGNFSNTSTIKRTLTNYTRYIKPVTELSFSKNISGNQSSAFLNDNINYELKATFSRGVKDLEIEEPTIVDLLPQGMEYVNGSSEFTMYVSNITQDFPGGGRRNLEPTVIPNYKDSGRTGLVWDIGAFRLVRDVTYSSTIFTINYKAKVTELAQQGVNTNDARFGWKYESAQNINYINSVTGGSIVDDTYDINNNGDTSDKVFLATKEINYVPPRELIVKKEVKGSLDNVFLSDPSEATSELGTESQYQFTIFNNSVVDYNTFYMLDLFPMIDDRTVSEDQNLEVPERVSRGSTFSQTLTKPVTVPDKFEIFYTTDTPGTDMKQFTREGTWVKELDDYSKATAFLLKLKPGQTLSKTEEYVFTAIFTNATKYDLIASDKAVNSFGAAVNEGLSYTESNMVTNKLISYSVDGYVFDDFNKNGLYNEPIDKALKDNVVQLLDANGNVVLDLDGKPYHATTDENGYYKFDVYRTGNYTVKITTPSGYELTTPTEGELGSSIVSKESEKSSPFELSKAKQVARINGGYYKEKSTLIVEKEVLDSNGTELASDRSFKFEVKVNNVLYSGSAILDGETIQIQNGSVALKNQSKLTIQNIDKNSSYSIREIDTSGYLVTPVNGEYVGTLDETEKSLSFTNKYVIPKTSVTGTKVWIDGPETHPSIELQLYRNGEAYGEAVSVANGT
uniref:SdrD B-like domain-containing protein n=1 Tax=Erysipelothrix aquatica TaxID=2683714 RepID=UPI00135AE0F5